MWTSLEKNDSALKSGELTNYRFIDKLSPNLNFDTSFVIIG